MLNYIRVDNNSTYYKTLFENIAEAMRYINKQKNMMYFPSVYFLSNKIKDYDLSKIKIDLKRVSKESKIKQIEKSVEKAKEEYERALKELEDIKNV